MKHAILILAHKDFDQLRHLIEYFIKDCVVYVHIDKKAVITSEELHSIDSIPQVRAVYRKYKVHWGGFSILKTEMFLLRQVLKDGDCDYVHLISGQDYPIKPLKEFLGFFEKNKGKEFIRYANIPNPYWDHYSFSRFNYFYPYDYINKCSKEALAITRKIIKWERKLGIKRPIPNHFDLLYGSTQWFSISKDAVQILVRYTDEHPSFYKRARWTFASEEYYVATILCNNISHASIIKTDLRFIRWRNENGNFPANLGIEHFYLLSRTNPFFFARKMEGSLGKSLIELIDNYLLKDSPCHILNDGGWDYDGILKYSFNYQLARAIAGLCRQLQVLSILDLGCGAGFYVSALRRFGCLAIGYDSNPHIRKLSTLLLPSSDVPCDVADVTKDIDCDEPFDMTLCMELLSCIPKSKLRHVLNNIIKCSGKYIIISEKTDDNNLRLLVQCEEYLKDKNIQKNLLGTSILNNSLSHSVYTFILLERYY